MRQTILLTIILLLGVLAIPTNNYGQKVTYYGTGTDTVLVLHGERFQISTPLFMMLPAINEFVDSGYTVMTINYQVGHSWFEGGCDTDTSFFAAYGRACTDMVNVIDSVNQREIKIAGLSAGAMMALYGFGIRYDWFMDNFPNFNVPEFPWRCQVKALSLYSCAAPKGDLMGYFNMPVGLYWGENDTAFNPLMNIPCDINMVTGGELSNEFYSRCLFPIEFPNAGHYPIFDSTDYDEDQRKWVRQTLLDWDCDPQVGTYTDQDKPEQVTRRYLNMSTGIIETEKKPNSIYKVIPEYIR